ncbi:MAG: signal peptidase I [Propionibacteriaceae bacterium]|jgi:signal peptidase I|nr:signal peptidase I [Propionibacteriaceae bacterium]
MAPVEERQDRRSAAQVLGSWLKELVIVVLGALVASTLLRVFVIQMFNIPSESMENTLLVGDRVAVQKVTGYQRGDVIVFQDTQHWLADSGRQLSPLEQALVFIGFAPDESKGYLVKRLIGMPGDHVACCDAQGRVTVNGVAVDETDYLYKDPTTGQQADPSLYSFDLVVPKGRVFVMGDHRNASEDSRPHLCEELSGQPKGMKGFVPEADIVGVGLAVVYPFTHWHGLGRSASWASVPDPTGDPPAEPVVTVWPDICG